MTETKTAEKTAGAHDVVGDAERHYDELGARSLATIRPDQQQWDPNQTAILRQLGLEDATQGDLDLFFHVCSTTGLDPFRREIYMIGRNTKVTEWVEDERAQNGRRRVDRWVTKYTIQIAIDGYRNGGRRTAQRLGDTLQFDGPYWCGDDGEWREVWPAKTPPVAAKYSVIRNGEANTAVVHYDEFVQTNNAYEGSGSNRRVVGQEPNSMWAKSPRNQIAKCAEAMAFRRAYPDSFAGAIHDDAAQPLIIDSAGNVESGPREPTRAGGVDKLRERAKARKQNADAVNADAVNAEVVDAEKPIEPDVTPEPPGDGQMAGDADPTADAEAGQAEATASPPEPNPSPGPTDTPMSSHDRARGLAMMHGLLINGGIDTDEIDATWEVVSELAAVNATYRPIRADADLTDAELLKVVNTLRDWKTNNKLVAWLGEALNNASLRAAGMLEPGEAK